MHTLTLPTDLHDAGFTSATVETGRTAIHYVRGGTGPARQFTVIAPDLRGVGGSTPTPDGYDTATLARDIHDLLTQLDTGPAHLAGHDIGGQVTYTFARRYPESTRTATILETPIPGIAPWDDLNRDIPLWHGAFHMVPDLPETLVADRQAPYFRYFFDTGTTDHTVISDTDLAHYAAAYGDPARLRSAFEFYRAFPTNIADNTEHVAPIDIPLLLVGGEHVFGPICAPLADNLTTNYGWSDVDTHIIAGGRHYLVEEYPDEVADLIERHTSRREQH